MNPLTKISETDKKLIKEQIEISELKAGYEKMIAEKRAKSMTEANENISLSTEAAIVNSCYAGDYLYQTDYWQGDVVVGKKYELEILEPTKDSEAWITEEPKMPEVICKARLKNYNKGEVTFEWEYWVSYELFRRDRRKKEQPWLELCSRTGKVMFFGNSTSINEDITLFDVNFSKEYATSIKFNANQPEIANWIDYGGDCSEERVSWEEGNDIFIGGDVWIKVTAKNQQNQILDWDTLSVGKLLGGQISKQSVLSGIDIPLKAIIYNETSYRKYQQFNLNNNGKYNPKGYPIYGYPNGFGLLQIDNPPPSELQLWNWKENRAEGQRRHDRNINLAQNYGNRIRNGNYIDNKEKNLYKIKISKNNIIIMKYINATDLVTDEQLLKDAFQRYNSGRPYWYWKAEFPNDENSDGNWETNTGLQPLPKHKYLYAEEVWCIYESFLQGNENPINCYE